jgi:hypothetical protein
LGLMSIDPAASRTLRRHGLLRPAGRRGALRLRRQHLSHYVGDACQPLHISLLKTAIPIEPKKEGA